MGGSDGLPSVIAASETFKMDELLWLMCEVLVRRDNWSTTGWAGHAKSVMLHPEY